MLLIILAILLFYVLPAILAFHMNVLLASRNVIQDSPTELFGLSLIPIINVVMVFWALVQLIQQPIIDYAAWFSDTWNKKG